mmetsp:Transcript_13646/g.42227  ORF Transcript_13646/g.42227 Transcript_13646/m.42227 type:complete len:214 (-) Transcript_13646:25-666(-)
MLSSKLLKATRSRGLATGARAYLPSFSTVALGATVAVVGGGLAYDRWMTKMRQSGWSSTSSRCLRAARYGRVLTRRRNISAKIRVRTLTKGSVTQAPVQDHVARLGPRRASPNRTDLRAQRGRPARRRARDAPHLAADVRRRLQPRGRRQDLWRGPTAHGLSVPPLDARPARRRGARRLRSIRNILRCTRPKRVARRPRPRRLDAARGAVSVL